MYAYFEPITYAHRFSHSDHQNPLVEDIVNGIINFRNGIQFRGVWNFNASALNKKEECSIYGTKGNIQFTFFGDKVSLTTELGTEIFSFSNPKHIQQPMIKATVDYFLDKGENPCHAEDGLVVMDTLEKLSGRTGYFENTTIKK